MAGGPGVFAIDADYRKPRTGDLIPVQDFPGGFDAHDGAADADEADDHYPENRLSYI